ncbi:DNA-binding protein RFXANK [Drosophila nasuta]|uniref:DNA-binding protein RFXANK n=1 Tax=Drosophila albomicans TaxID=7291 RepID=A0A6P8WTM4_DROAB|nr:DNA-binding protein RFXANK [Drosophila albomicans]XP_060644933.1 DNA-binding protein RFXANK [Drosophila nasuta]
MVAPTYKLQSSTNSEDDEPIRPAQVNAPTSSTLHASSILLDANSTKRKSAFLPYRPQSTVLTNLQRGNTEATFCPVEVSLSFHERAGQGEITEEQVNAELLRQHSIDIKDSHGFTPLHWAASYGQMVSTQLLVAAGANVNSLAPDMITPLLLAAAGGHNEIVRFLLDRGASGTHMDIVGNTALMYAAAGNHPHTCNELLSKDLDFSATNENGDTAYALAVENGSHLAQALLEQYMTAVLTAGAFGNI